MSPTNPHDPADPRDDVDGLLDRLVGDVRNDTPDPDVAREASLRVRARLDEQRFAMTDDDAGTISGGDATGRPRPLSGCADYRALVPAYVAGDLSRAKCALLEDHLGECAACRHFVEAASTGEPVRVLPAAWGGTSGAEAVTRSRRAVAARRSRSRWVAAAAAALLLGVAGLFLLKGTSLLGPAAPVAVRVAEGEVYRIAGSETMLASSGGELAGSDLIRTPRDSGAVIALEDGTLVEMNARTGLSVSMLRDGPGLWLERGNIIVRAAKQASGRLSVITDDCRVYVTGTIFSVNHGTRGSRVSVIEGEVKVDRNGSLDVLHPGDQVTTRDELGRVPVLQEIAWSRDVEKYTALLHELRALGEEIDRRIPDPERRYSSTLLDRVPADTVFYAAVPNVAGSLATAHEVLEERLADSPLLREWWQQWSGSDDARAKLEQSMDRVRGFGEQLGDEIVLAATPDGRGGFGGLVLLAELSHPAAFPVFLRDQIAGLNDTSAGGGSGARITLVTDPLAAGPGGTAAEGLLLWVDGDTLVGASSRQALRTMAAAPGTGFASTPFHDRLLRAYGEGASYLVGVDVRKIVEMATAKGGDTSMLQRLGLSDVLYIVARRHDADGKENLAAEVDFEGPRRGVASWLARPAPMGALDYVSPDANLLAAFVVSDPVALLDDLVGMAGHDGGGAPGELERLSKEQGVDLRGDLAGSLGGEFAFAFDGPVLPVPAWKAVLEVYDPVRLQRGLDRLTDAFNRESAAADPTGAASGRLVLTRETVGGRTYYSLGREGESSPVHYVYHQGYLIAAPQRVLLDRAIQQRETGASISASPSFRSLLPEGTETNFSALYYQDIGPAFTSIAGRLAAAGGPVTPGQLDSPGGATGGGSSASLTTAFAGEDRILVSGVRQGSLGTDLGGLLSMVGGDGLWRIMEGRPQGADEPGRGVGEPGAGAGESGAGPGPAGAGEGTP